MLTEDHNRKRSLKHFHFDDNITIEIYPKCFVFCHFAVSQKWRSLKKLFTLSFSVLLLGSGYREFIFSKLIWLL